MTQQELLDPSAAGAAPEPGPLAIIPRVDAKDIAVLEARRVDLLGRFEKTTEIVDDAHLQEASAARSAGLALIKEIKSKTSPPIVAAKAAVKACEELQQAYLAPVTKVVNNLSEIMGTYATEKAKREREAQAEAERKLRAAALEQQRQKAALEQQQAAERAKADAERAKAQAEEAARAAAAAQQAAQEAAQEAEGWETAEDRQAAEEAAQAAAAAEEDAARARQAAEDAEKAAAAKEAEPIPEISLEGMRLPTIRQAPSAAPKLEGTGFRDNWRWEIVDEEKIPSKFKVVDEAKITRVVKALHEGHEIPGIRVWCEKIPFGKRS